MRKFANGRISPDPHGLRAPKPPYVPNSFSHSKTFYLHDGAHHDQCYHMCRYHCVLYDRVEPSVDRHHAVHHAVHGLHSPQLRDSLTMNVPQLEDATKEKVAVCHRDRCFHKLFRSWAFKYSHDVFFFQYIVSHLNIL